MLGMFCDFSQILIEVHAAECHFCVCLFICVFVLLLLKKTWEIQAKNRFVM